MLKLLIVVLVISVATCLGTRRLQEQCNAKPLLPRPHRPAPPRRPLAPDDDPEFLRELDRKRRHPKDPDES